MNSGLSNGVSVIMCCYNSRSRLKQTLACLAAQEINEDLSCELILVDNNSTDDTVSFTTETWKKIAPQIPFRIVQELKPGLTYARETGAAAALYEILIFCDDDNLLEKNYIQQAFNIMQVQPKAGIAGGRSTGAFETKKPEWFDRFGFAYAIGHPLKASGIANQRTFLAGAGMVIRKSIVAKLNTLHYTPVISDRSGSSLISGGDAELCFAVMSLGYDLYYDEKLQFTHYMTAPRIQWPYCVLMMSEGHAIPQLYLFLYHFIEACFKNNEAADFAQAYQKIRKSIFKRSIKCLFFQKPFWLPFVFLMKTQPGSRKEIDLKANLNKLKYLIKHKKDLHFAFDTIHTFYKNLYSFAQVEKPV